MASTRIGIVFFACAYLSLLLEGKHFISRRRDLSTSDLGVAGGCANGFIQLDLLKTVAQKIPRGQLSNNSLDNELRLIPDWNFTCNGTITSFLLGADIRINTDFVIEYPEVQIWRRTDPSLDYMKVWSEEIRLNAGSFSPSGVLEYRLNNSFNFQAGDFFGIYQPEARRNVVRIYYNSSDNTAPIAHTFTDNNMNTYSTSGSYTMIADEFILISPVVGTICTIDCD